MGCGLEGNGTGAQFHPGDGQLHAPDPEHSRQNRTAWNVSTIFKQATALFSSLADVPAVDYWKGFAKLMAGQLETRKVWNSRAIQDRIASGYPPEARMALETMFNQKPNISGELVQKGMELIGNVDAFFTTGLRCHRL
jgi:hypothetical protein